MSIKTVAEFMQEAMYNPKNGYYIKQNPIGRARDFITAPEISQLFGEIIGIFCVSEWMRIGSPASFNLIELGPGRGTMMQDILRGTKHVKGFKEAINLHFVETNENHIKIQKELFLGNWHSEISSVLFDKPFILLANEFFDCLPINQYIFSQDGWCERCIIDNKDFVNVKVDHELAKYLSREYQNVPINSIVEINYPARNMVEYLCQVLKTMKGSVLIIDYGYDLDLPLGSSLQAIKSHKFHSIFENIGEADLTAHVDFRALRKIALENKLNPLPVMTQRDFLLKYGIDLRASILMKNALTEESEDIKRGLSRLIDNNQMGELFKVLNISYQF